MDVFETYAQRKKRTEQAGQPDVYEYDEIPQTFRQQVLTICDSCIGPYQLRRVHGNHLINPSSHPIWTIIHDGFADAIGFDSLSHSHKNPYEKCVDYLKSNDTDTDNVLGLIEAIFIVLLNVEDDEDLAQQYPLQGSASKAVELLNFRFKQNNLGYQLVSGKIIRLDSEYIHSEIVKNALQLLRGSSFAGASQEFWKAHSHYTQENYKEALVEAHKAFESTMKTICDLRGWGYVDPSRPNLSPSAKPLVDTMIREKLIPEFLSTHLKGLANVLVEGAPLLRNILAGHGQGAVVVEVPAYFAAYALHLTASNIVFLVEAHKVKPL
jgi:hypothetical protein